MSNVVMFFNMRNRAGQVGTEGVSGAQQVERLIKQIEEGFELVLKRLRIIILLTKLWVG
jgi:hypothetical protein